MVVFFFIGHLPERRNWQTHQTQNRFTGKISNFLKSVLYLHLQL